MKIYKGRRLIPENGTVSPTEILVCTLDEEGKEIKSERLRHHVYHSPTGMNWGYGGSGPADLARSILWDVLGEEPEMVVYQNFKHQFVAGWGATWEWTEKLVLEWLEDFSPFYKSKAESIIARYR